MKNREGYQLVESMILCLILVGMGGAGILNFRDSLAQYRLQWAAQMLTQDLSLARSTALTRHLPISVVVREDGRGYSIVEKPAQAADYRQLPRGLFIVKKPGRVVTFYSRGSAVPAGSYVLSNRVGELKVVVSGAGRVRWKYGNQE